MACNGRPSGSQSQSTSNRLVEGADALFRVIESEALTNTSACFTPSPRKGSVQSPILHRPRAPPAYPRIWNRGHDEALLIFAACLPLLCRQALYKLPFFDAWSAYGHSPLSVHIKNTMKRMLKKLDVDFELPVFGKSSSTAGLNLPDEVVRAMEAAILAGKSTVSTPVERSAITSSASSPSRKPIRGLILPPKTPPGRRKKRTMETDSELTDYFDSPSATPPPASNLLPVTPRRSNRASRAKLTNGLRSHIGASTGEEEEKEAETRGEGSKSPFASLSSIRKRSRVSSDEDDDGDLWLPESPRVTTTKRPKVGKAAIEMRPVVNYPEPSELVSSIDRRVERSRAPSSLDSDIALDLSLESRPEFKPKSAAVTADLIDLTLSDDGGEVVI